MRTPLLYAAAVLTAAALTSCSDQVVDKAPPRAPAESAFAEGSCRLAAPDVLAVGRDARNLGEGGKVDAAVKDSLRDSQERLAALAETATPDVKPVLDRFVVAIGLVRVRADGNTYETSLGTSLLTSYDAVLAACTGPTPS